MKIMNNDKTATKAKGLIVLATVLTFSLLPVSVTFAQSESAHSPAGQVAGAGSVDGQKVDKGLAGEAAGKVAGSLEDHRATVFNVSGEVKILKKGSEEWLLVQKNMPLEQGDQILTGKDSFVEFAYDRHFLNIARIEQNTKAEFLSIEPTDLHLEDGTIFNALDGLAGGSYQISTPTAVAGVRGTTFDFAYDAGSQTVEVNVFADPSSHVGAVDLQFLEGNPINLTENQSLASDGKIGEIPQEKQEFANTVLASIDQNFGEFREQGGEALGIEIKPAETQPALSEDGESGDKAASDDSADSEGLDENKPANDGNPPPGGGSMPQNGGDHASGSGVDAMLDSGMIPPKDFVAADPEGGKLTPFGAIDPNFKDPGSFGPLQQGDPHPVDPGQVDMGKMFEFFAMGGGFDHFDTQGNFDPAQMGGQFDFLPDFFDSLGFSEEQSDKLAAGFTDAIGQMSDHPDFMPTEFIGGMPSFTEMGSMPMMGEFGDMFGDFAGNFGDFGGDFDPEGFGDFNFDFANIKMDFSDLTREFSIDQNLLTFLVDQHLAANNPFYFTVLGILESNLTATEKNSLLTLAVTEILRGGAVLGNVDADGNSERILGVRYALDPYNSSLVNATYDKIIESVVEGGAVIQDSGSGPGVNDLLIYDVSACNSGNPEDPIGDSVGAC